MPETAACDADGPLPFKQQQKFLRADRIRRKDEEKKKNDMQYAIPEKCLKSISDAGNKIGDERRHVWEKQSRALFPAFHRTDKRLRPIT